jgi:hypothetical protein
MLIMAIIQSACVMNEEEKWAWAENACRMTGKGAVSEGAQWCQKNLTND